MRLNLSQQGLILVGVPIGLMLAFLMFLSLLLMKVEREAAENDHSRTTIATANSLVKQYYDAASRLIIYKHTRDEESRQNFLDQVNGTEESFRNLELLLKNDASQLKRLAQLKNIANQGMELMHRYERHILGTERMKELDVAILYKGFDIAGAQFTAKLDQLVAHETAKHKIGSQEERTTRNLVKILILTGVFLACGVGISLARYFSKNTTSRLDLLMNNTVRLSRKEQLLPRLSGEDEISRLDDFFHRMADQLVAAAKKERAILDNAVDVICSIGSDGHFVAANPACRQVWGYDPNKLTTMHYREIIAEADRTKFAEALEHSHSGKGMENVETSVLNAAGEPVPMLWSIRWSEPEQSLFCVAHDITDRKEVERVKQEFVAVISHELRTPLTSLQATLTLLMDGAYGPISETAENRLKSAEFGISRLISLINDLLDIEKMEAGKLTMLLEDVDIAAIVERALPSVAGFAEQQGVLLETGDSPHLIVRADPDRIVQVLVNLISNSIKFSDDGATVKLKVACEETSAEIQVVDHGAGVPEGLEDSIFSKYEQAHVSRERKKRGTGLGLPICKAIVEQHGGTIGVKKTEGGGSTFWFRVPLTSSFESEEQLFLHDSGGQAHLRESGLSTSAGHPVSS